MAKPKKIAIDGPASSGKSTIAKLLAADLDLVYLDTGAMYRALTYQLLEEGIEIEDQTAVREAIDHFQVTFKQETDGQHVYLNGQDVTRAIRQEAVNLYVSPVSAIREVRNRMVELQRAMISSDTGIVMDGRDIGTVVMPDAKPKIFLVASPEERARRRLLENQEKGLPVESFEAMLEAIKARDLYDSSRKESPLKKAQDAIEIDTTSLSIEEVLETIKNHL